MKQTLSSYLWNIRYGILILIGVGLALVVYQKLVKFYYGKDYARHDWFNYRHCETNFILDFCSKYAVSHFLLYFFLGLFFPQGWIFFIVIGIAFEILEWVVGLQYRKKGDIFPRIDTDGNLTYGAGWRAGNLKDIIANVSGLMLGIIVNKIFCDKMNMKV